MKINYTNRTIEISKAFANKAKNYGSNEYNLLKEALRDNAGFTVVVIAAKKKTSKKNKITLDDIKRYVSYHDDEEGTRMSELESLLKSKENGELYKKSFFEIKKWFFEVYSDIA